jgi:hypothetical protein
MIADFLHVHHQNRAINFAVADFYSFGITKISKKSAGFTKADIRADNLLVLDCGCDLLRGRSDGKKLSGGI